jgi:hypothetical protein
MKICDRLQYYFNLIGYVELSTFDKLFGLVLVKCLFISPCSILSLSIGSQNKFLVDIIGLCTFSYVGPMAQLWYYLSKHANLMYFYKNFLVFKFSPN